MTEQAIQASIRDDFVATFGAMEDDLVTQALAELGRSIKVGNRSHSLPGRHAEAVVAALELAGWQAIPAAARAGSHGATQQARGGVTYIPPSRQDSDNDTEGDQDNDVDG